MSPPRIDESPLGAQQLHLNGQIYHTRLRLQGKTNWRCSRRRTNSCNASAITQHTGNRMRVLKEREQRHPQLEEHRSDDDDHVNDDDEKDDDEDETDESSSDHKNDDSASDDEEQEFCQGESGSDSSSDVEDSSSDEEECSDESEESYEWKAWHESSGEEEGHEENSSSEIEAASEEVAGIDLLHSKVKRYRSILQTLRQVRNHMREAILSTADKGLICLLCEICLNILRGAITFTKTEKNLLRPFEGYIQVLASKDMSWREKRNGLVDSSKDAFIPVLLNVTRPYM